MSNSLKDRLKTDLQSMKAEGGTRTSRIREILQSAATQTLTELKEGATEIKLTASQSVSSIAQSFNDSESSESSLLNRLIAQVKILDAKLVDRYGDRYTTFKQRFGLFQTWYNNTKTNAETVGMTPVEQKQAEIELRVADQGTIVARKEQQIRQQVKELLTAAISKR
ncbi:hypothetical protein ACQ4M3_38140 [Leptolyngbya sp. AN03gr2]|uniref:hypothetical protein n=1 Tax=unclassified Leptolyngbya TaxID=2650499 RepID=UPI003D31B77F